MGDCTAGRCVHVRPLTLLNPTPNPVVLFAPTNNNAFWPVGINTCADRCSMTKPFPEGKAADRSSVPSTVAPPFGKRAKRLVGTARAWRHCPCPGQVQDLSLRC